MVHTLFADVGRAIALAVLLFLVGAFVVGYANSLRRSTRLGLTDRTVDAEIRHRVDALRRSKPPAATSLNGEPASRLSRETGGSQSRSPQDQESR